MSRYHVGKSMEVMGLIVVMLAVFYGMFERSMAKELYLFCGGGIVFYIGYLLERGVRSGS